MVKSRKIILTGFGLFDRSFYNVSGALAESFANQEQSDCLKLGKLSADDHGFRKYFSTCKIKNEFYDVTTLLLDVVWSSSAEILVKTMEDVQPDLVLMMGRSSSDKDIILEGGALNKTNAHPGYKYDGTPSVDNVAPQDWILEHFPDELQMTWNHREISDQISSSLHKQGFNCIAASGARLENTYICNNISYAALASTLGKPMSFVSGHKKWTPTIKSNPKIGFLHLPKTIELTSDNINFWIGIIEDVIYYS